MTNTKDASLRAVKMHIAEGDKSYVGSFMRKHFPLAHDFYKKNTLQLQKCRMIQPPSAPYPYQIVGSAFENRIHLAFGNFQPSLAQLGFDYLMCSDERLEEELGGLPSATYVEIFYFLQKIRSYKYDSFGNDSEVYRGRMSYFLSQLEFIGRSGRQIVLSEPSVAVLEDLNLLTLLFFQQHSAWLDLPYRAKPVFGQKELIGGDGDLIIDKTLVDIKVTKNSRFTYKYLHQVMLYTLLSGLNGAFIRNDLEIGRSPITKLGIYFARHGELLTWDVDEILDIFQAPTRLELMTELLQILIENYKERNSFEANTPVPLPNQVGIFRFRGQKAFFGFPEKVKSLVQILSVVSEKFPLHGISIFDSTYCKRPLDFIEVLDGVHSSWISCEACLESDEYLRINS